MLNQATKPIFKTKLYIPKIHHAVVDRPRLVELINAGVQSALTLVSAPAGFGKTTALVEWVKQSPLPVAWLSLDEGDNDPAQFFLYLITALQSIDSNLGADALALLQSPQPLPSQSILSALLLDLEALLEPFAFVLDDFHTITAPELQRAFLYLLEHIPSALHLIVATRIDPPIPLSRFRAQREMVELRVKDLRFSLEETNSFFNQMMGLPLRLEDTSALANRTEGWIAGLQMAALSLQDREDRASFIQAFSGSNRYIIDYLVEEVLSRQPEGVQQFLLSTSLFDRLCGSLCDSVMQAGDGQVKLEQLEKANLFLIPLDDDRHWYRYHHLFSELLRDQLRRKDPGLIPQLHLRASQWFKDHGLLDSAIQHALAGGDQEIAAQWILEVGDITWIRGEFNTLLRWLSALSPETRVAKPRLGILLGWSISLSGQLDRLSAVEAELDVIEARLLSSATLQADGSSDAKTFGMLCTVRGVIASAFHQDDGDGLERAKLTLRYLPETSLVWRGAATLSIGHAYNARGDVPRALATYTEAIPLNQAAGNLHLALRSAVYRIMQLYQAGQMTKALQEIQNLVRKTSLLSEAGQPTFVGAHLTSGMIHYEWNHLDEALEDIEQAIHLGERWNNHGMIISGLVYQTLIYQALGDAQRVEIALETARRLVRLNDQVAHLYATEVDALQTLIWLRQDQIELACSWASGQVLPDQPGSQGDIHSVVLARVLVRSGRADQALDYLEKARRALEAHGQITLLMGILVQQALALSEAGQFEAALQPLQHTLEIGEGEGFLRVFLDEGQPLAVLLEAALPRLPECLHAYAQKLLFAFQHTRGASRPAAGPVLVEPLTAREVLVLRLIVAGKSNREIAASLYLATSTVKRHINHIFAKLGVNTRAQAIALARDQKLV